MSITKINSGLTLTTKIELLNDMILELDGKIAQANFNKVEIDQLFVDEAFPRRYIRQVAIGNTISSYTGFTHIHAESGYSVWKYSPTNYAANANNQLYFDNKLLSYKGTALSESILSFDQVWTYDTGGGYVDNTTEAGTEDGTNFDLMDSTTDYLYVGAATTFAGITFEWETRGSGYTLVFEYWNGSAWTVMDENTDYVVDNTSNFESDGNVVFVAPGSWSTTTVNGVASKYWIRISTSTTPATTASAYLITPANSVVTLLELSSTQFFAEEWAWCDYNNSIYVTIRNTGATSAEGDFFVTSASSVANLKNFFVYNHQYMLDHRST